MDTGVEGSWLGHAETWLVGTVDDLPRWYYGFSLNAQATVVLLLQLSVENALSTVSAGGG